MKIHIIPVLQDNYAYILESQNGDIAVIDPGEAAPVIDWLENHNKHLTHIINTHHHGDHIAGNDELKSKYSAILAAPKADKHRIPGIDIPLEEGSPLPFFGDEKVQIIDIPGHTTGHIALYFPAYKALFCGDTLFSLGCGRLFEGTAAQMWNSLEKLMTLPDDTLIYPGHEYTLLNGEFCLRIEPDNAALTQRMKEAQALRSQNLPTIPTTMKLEKQTNAFLRAGSAENFAKIRRLKDQG